MRLRVFLFAAALTLSACGPDSQTNKVTPTPLPTPSPTPWLSREPLCSGTITRAEWLVCDNATLNDLHRRLATQWEVARMHANDEDMMVQEDQLYALLSERASCSTVECVSKAYRRYLDSPPPAPKPPAKTKPKPKPKPKLHKTNWRPPSRDGLQDCSKDIGWSEANELANRCDAVTRGSNGICSPRRSCATLENVIDKGCRTSRRPPDFCPR